MSKRRQAPACSNGNSNSNIVRRAAFVGEGRIEEGDAGRLEKIIPLADRDRYGNIALYLDSPGGSVPGELAIQQSTKVELIVNLTTAKTLGIRLPTALIARADEIVD